MPHADARISPTAHYTSYVWYANGLSHEALTSRLGRVLYRTLRPLNGAHDLLTRSGSLETMLLARHRIIDGILAEAIESGRVRQVVEIAAGLSPRGFRFVRRFPGLRYLEGDLPAMAAHKRAALAGAGLLREGHDVVHLDALVDHGPASFAGVTAARLDPSLGTAVITEGLTGYIDQPSLEGMWRRLARGLARFPDRLYLADLVMGADSTLSARAFAVLLGAVVRGRVHLHYADGAHAEEALRAAGFATVRLHVPDDGERRSLVRIVEAI
jgi:O-methyltransferase involved in polyketide biosynthesis